MESNDLRIFQMVAYEESISKVAFKNNDADSSLKIGATHTIAASLVPKWLSKYSKKYPDVVISLKTDTQKNLAGQVISGELDGAFTNLQYFNHNISSYFSFIEELAIISSIDIKETDDLIQKPIIVSNNIDCPFRVILEKWIILNKGTPNRIIEFDSIEAIIKYVEDGMGISLLPKGLIKNNHRVCIHKLPNEFNKMTIYFIKRNDSNINHLVNDFINILSEG